MKPFKKMKKFGAPHDHMEPKSSAAKKSKLTLAWLDEIEELVENEDSIKIAGGSITAEKIYSSFVPEDNIYQEILNTFKSPTKYKDLVKSDSNTFTYTMDYQMSPVVLHPNDFVKLSGGPPPAEREDTEAALWDE